MADWSDTAVSEQPVDDEIAADVEERIKELDALTDPEYKDVFTVYLRDPSLVDQLAFRSPKLAARSLQVCLWLLENVRTTLRGTDDRRRAYRLELLRNAARKEERVLRTVVDGLRAQQGILPFAPNPRRRAEHRVWQLLLRGDTVTPEMAKRILSEEHERDRQRRAEERERRRQRKREAAARRRERVR